MPPGEVPFNQQPGWLNDSSRSDQSSQLQVGDLIVSDSTYNVDATIDTSYLASIASGLGTSLNRRIFENIICERHNATIRETVRETVTFMVDGTSETFCMKCLLEIIKERISPINQSPRAASDSTSERNMQRFSRYDLIKGKNGTVI